MTLRPCDGLRGRLRLTEIHPEDVKSDAKKEGVSTSTEMFKMTQKMRYTGSTERQVEQHFTLTLEQLLRICCHMDSLLISHTTRSAHAPPYK